MMADLAKLSLGFALGANATVRAGFNGVLGRAVYNAMQCKMQ